MRFNIQYKFIVLITLIIVLLLSGIYLYLNDHLSEYTYQRIRATISKELTFAESYIKSSYTGKNTIEQIDGIADRIGSDLQLRTTIIDKTGVVLGDSQLNAQEIAQIENHLYRPEIQQSMTYGKGESRRFSSTVRQDMLYVAKPLTLDGLTGYIRLSLPLSEIVEMNDGLRRFLVVACIAAFIVALISGSFAAYFFTRPIKEMSFLAKELAGGNFKRMIHQRSHDEIGDLAESINFMSEQIKSKIEEVTRNQSRQEAVLLSMFEGLMVVDEAGRIILMNQRLKDFLRVAQEPLGRKPLEVIRNIDIQDLTDKALLLDKGVESKEITVHLPQERTLKIHATPVIREGRSEGVVLVFHDISELKRLENVRRDFVANVSHELRTPLTSIKGYAETLLEGAMHDKQHAKEFLDIIYTDASRLANLVNDLLDLAKLESGKMELDFKPCSLEPVIDRVFAALANAAKNKPVELKKEIPPKLPKVLMDETSIAQLLLNLVDNAIKYNKISGTVIIGAQEDGATIKVSVKDTGIGIPSEDLPRIFERFYRVDKARSRELGGTGLGLSIVKHIIQSHGGDVTVESTPGKGSTFILSLPKA